MMTTGHDALGAAGRFLMALALGASLLAFTSCGGESYEDHKPPVGQGSLVVDNETVDDIDVYINGARRGTAGDFDSTIIDLEPGVYRVVLTGDDSDRSYSGDVDVLQGQLTILDVWADPNDIHAYSASVRYE